jgi:DNA-binding Lrp family transcriptional regulator
VLQALGDSYIPQYVGRLQGDYSFMMYAVARSYQEINAYIIDFSKRFKEPLVSELNKINRHLGYFPLRNELLKNFNVSETYLTLLMGLNADGRQGFKNIAKLSRKDPAIIQYAMDRLRRTEILHRISYYEGKPRNVVNALIQMKVTNYDKFMAKRNRWFLSMINGYNNRHNEYVCIYDISNPQGAVVLGSFRDSNSAGRFFEELKKNNAGVELKYVTLTKTILGHLGVRDFDMRYSTHYQYLERQKLVPQFHRKGGKYISADTEPDEEEIELESEPAEQPGT